METNATRMCALLVGLPAVTVLGVEDRAGRPLQVHVETTAAMEGCAGCGTRAWVKDRPTVGLVDLPAFGRPVVLVWRKRRWRRPERACEVGTWTEDQPAIAPARAAMTDRAGRWATAQVGREGRTVAGVARELRCDWHTIMAAVVAYGTPLIADAARIATVTALGLDETLFARTGPRRTQVWCTSIVDVTRPAQLLDVVPGRSAAGASTWLEARPPAWRRAIRWGVLDLAGSYRKAFTDSLPDAAQVAPPGRGLAAIVVAASTADEGQDVLAGESSTTDDGATSSTTAAVPDEGTGWPEVLSATAQKAGGRRERSGNR